EPEGRAAWNAIAGLASFRSQVSHLGHRPNPARQGLDLVGMKRRRSDSYSISHETTAVFRAASPTRWRQWRHKVWGAKQCRRLLLVDVNPRQQGWQLR